MKEANTTSSTSGVKFNHEQLYTALMDAEDLMDRLLTPYFLLGETANAVKHDLSLEGDGIDIGIRDKSLTQYVYSILDSEKGLKQEDVENGFEYLVSGVPVRVKIYTRNYPFFSYPDFKTYLYGNYQLANPFDMYWKVRGLI